jgi:ADP-ribosylglycohydrolase
LEKKSSLEEAIFQLGNSSYALEAFPLSLFIFLKNIENPQRAFFEAVNSYGKFGGDTDAIGYLVGAYLGAYFGMSAFDTELVEKLEKVDYYISLSERLWEITMENFPGGQCYGI